MNIQELISKMTLEEKASLCSGNGWWCTKSVDRLGIPSVNLTDGPHGLRKQVGAGDHLGLNDSVPATCFPTAAGIASSFDRELIATQARALGAESQANDVYILLGPGTTLKRSPLCGRNFEYFSEDPVLAGEMSASYIEAIQSTGVGTSLKHYAMNNQETARMSGNSVVDERTMHELYLLPFEIAVRKSQPTSVMCCYNQVNGVFGSENDYILNHALRELWGFENFVVTDWGAMHDRVISLKAGCDLEMPSMSTANDEKIVAAVRSGELDEAVLDKAVTRMLNVLYRWLETGKKEQTVDLSEHHKLARKIAGNTMVLAKNNGVLPLSTEKTTAIIGAYAKKIMFQGGGSSHINNPYEDNVVDEFEKIAPGKVVYAQGCAQNGSTTDELIAEAVAAAKSADQVLIVAGSPMETEGADRKDMKLPDGVVKMITAVAEARPDAALALTCGAPVELPFLDKLGALLIAYLGGQASAGAIVDIVSGAVNPSAKLAETWPVNHRQSPAHPNFGRPGDVHYEEGVFIGYRWFDIHDIRPVFRFGHGLSYTTFEYGEPTASATEITDNDELTISVDVTNTGSRAGAEIVQLYVGQDAPKGVTRPVKELKGFEKVHLEPGETKTVSFKLCRRAWAYWSTQMHDWVVESGSYTVSVGKSSCPYCQKPIKITMHSTSEPATKLTIASSIGEVIATPHAAEVMGPLLQMITNPGAALAGAGGPPAGGPEGMPPPPMGGAPEGMPPPPQGDDGGLGEMFGDPEAMKEMMMGSPLSMILMFAGDMIKPEMLQGMLDQINKLNGLA